MSETICVTGISGFIGKSLLDRIAQETHSKYRFIGLYNGTQPTTSIPQAEYVHCNLLNQQEISEVIRQYQPSTLVHLAWFVEPNTFWTSIENLAWLKSSLTLFEQFCRNGGKRFIVAGSISEYDLTQNTISERSTLLQPTTLYGTSKLCLYKLIKSLRDTFFSGVYIIWPRIAWFFGENEPSSKLFSTLFDKLCSDSPICLQVKNLMRPYSHVRNVGKILYRCLELQKDLDFIVSGQHNISLESIVQLMASYIGKKDYALSYTYKQNQTTLSEYKILAQTMKELMPSLSQDSFRQDLEEFVKYKLQERIK